MAFGRGIWHLSLHTVHFLLHLALDPSQTAELIMTNEFHGSIIVQDRKNSWASQHASVADSYTFLSSVPDLAASLHSERMRCACRRLLIAMYPANLTVAYVKYMTT